MTRITFVALGCEQLGVSQLSAVLRSQGHTVNLAFSYSLFNDRYNLNLPRLAPHFDDQSDVMDEIRRFKPEMICYSALTSTYQWMLEVAKQAKHINPGVFNLFGGVHSSAIGEAVLKQPFVDGVCVGEGEQTVSELARALDKSNPGLNKSISNLTYRSGQQLVKGPTRGFIQDLDTLPAFDKKLWENHLRLGDLYITMASRGCPFRCTFCFNNFFADLPKKSGLSGKQAGKYVRQRSVDHMMNELLLAKKRYRLRVVAFEDDIFTLNKPWLEEFLSRYRKEIGLPFQCLTHPQFMDLETAHLLKESGCGWIQMGIQTMDENFKTSQLRRYEKTQKIEHAMDVMLKAGLNIKADHMLAIPGEPPEAQEPARKLFASYTPARVQTFWTQYLPGTQMVDNGLKRGWITSEEVSLLNEGKDFNFFHAYTRSLTPEQIRFYQLYETLFKLIPVLPRFLRKKIQVKHLRVLPHCITSRLGFWMDTISGLLRSNPEHHAYAKHYVFSIWVMIQKKLPRRAKRIAFFRDDPSPS